MKRGFPLKHQNCMGLIQAQELIGTVLLTLPPMTKTSINMSWIDSSAKISLKGNG